MQAETEAAKVVIKSTPEERRRFLSNWADQFPDATIAAAQRALRDNFGQTIFTKDISTILKGARQKLRQDTSPPQPTQPATTGLTPTDLLTVANLTTLSPQTHDFLQSLTWAIRRAGIRKIEVRADGTVSIDIAI